MAMEAQAFLFVKRASHTSIPEKVIETDPLSIVN
jgi:hypothetical protein